MNILHAGNLANFGYLAAKVLRSYDINAELLARKPINSTEDPKSQDTELENTGYPDWIKFYDTSKSGWKVKILKQMKNKKYDLIHTYVELSIFAMVSGKKFVSHTLGSDLAELALTKSFKGMLLRSSYHIAKVIVFVPHHYAILEKLGLSSKGVFVPFIVDHEKFLPKKIENIPPKYHNKFIIFHPTNQIWDVKGNDKFLRAFIRLVKENKNLFLILGDRGKNIQDAKKLIENSAIQNHVEIIPTQTQEMLRYYYNLSDVVADNFGYGTLGGIALESMSSEKPVLTIISDIYSTLYKQIPPVINVQTEEAIYDSINQLINSESLRFNIGKKSRKWIIQNNSKEIFAKRCKILYEGILNELPLDEIRNKMYQVNQTFE